MRGTGYILRTYMVGRTEIRYAGVKQWTYRKKLKN